MSGSLQPLVGYGAAAYKIANSLRFRSSASAYLNRTFGTPTNTYKFTFSCWLKRGTVSGTTGVALIASDTYPNYLSLKFDANNDGSSNLGFVYGGSPNAYGGYTAAVFRDPSAWYHIVYAIDTTQATASNRVILYVNGIQQSIPNQIGGTSGIFPPQNTANPINTASMVNEIAAVNILGTRAQYFDGYLADINFIDGQALTPSSFGQINAVTGVWQPIAYTGTYGTNGFHLNFSNGTSTTTLGYDSSGNGNNWTTNNISLTAGSTYDWMLDSPTPYQGSSYGVGNYCTLNPLVPGASALSNGNLTSAGSTVYPTIQPTSGNWYFEINGVAQNWTPPAAFPTGTGDFNFGQRPFANTPTSGYKSLCTYNLPTPTIQNGAGYMAATLYTGTLLSNAVSNAVNGVGFQPDFVWIKSRSAATDHKLTDSVRGTTKALISDSTAAETTDSQGLTTFGSSGFTVGTDIVYNNLAATYVGWQWKAGGTAVTNTAGSITSSVSANTTSGFAVVTYTGTGSAATVGHGLGVAPSMIIVKSRTNISPYGGWPVYHVTQGNNKGCFLNTTAAVNNQPNLWNSTTPTSSVFSIGTDQETNYNTVNYVAYCFAAIPGYSAFGSYTGNGSTDGPFIYCGFRPRFVLIKNASSAYSWMLYDTSRNPYNVTDLYLNPNSSSAEGSGITYPAAIDILSNGFKTRNYDATYGPNINASGSTYIYAAFAENPFTNALAR